MPGPTKLGPKKPPGAGAVMPPQEHERTRPEPQPEAEYPADVARAMAESQAASASNEPSSASEDGPGSAPATVVAPGRSINIELHNANEGDPNSIGRRESRYREPEPDVQIALESLLGAKQKRPEDDLKPSGWRFPVYMQEAIRLLAFRLREPMEKVADELIYASMMGRPPGGILAGITQDELSLILQKSYKAAARALGHPQ